MYHTAQVDALFTCGHLVCTVHRLVTFIKLIAMNFEKSILRLTNTSY